VSARILGGQPTEFLFAITNTIRYGTVYLRALKADANPAHGTEMKNKEKLRTKTE